MLAAVLFANKNVKLDSLVKISGYGKETNLDTSKANSINSKSELLTL